MSMNRARLFIISITGVVLITSIISPLVMSYGSVMGLSGTPIIMDYGHLWVDLDPISMITYGFGDILCHQQSDRSLTINGSQMPICVRDLFIITGFLLGSIFMYLRRVDLPIRNVGAIVVITTIIMFTDHTVQAVFGLNIPITRAITGFLFGMAISLAVEYWIRYYEPPTHAQVY